MAWESRAARLLRLFMRTRIRKLSLRRVFIGGRLNDAGRLPRYALVATAMLAAIWTPVASYILLAPESYVSGFSLILPGTGVSTSINLSEIGQASSSSNSAFSSSAISPTVTYQKLFQSGRVLDRAARELDLEPAALGQPRVKLVDQTSLMRVELSAPTPGAARSRAEALMQAFMAELTVLRQDEIERRESSVTDTVGKYQQAVDAIRDRIGSLQMQTGLRSSDQFAAIADSSETLRAQIVAQEAEAESLGEAVAAMTGMLGVSADMAAAALKLQSDPDYMALAGALADAGAERAVLSQRFGPRHPQRMAAERRHLGLRLDMLDRAIEVSGLDSQTLEQNMEWAADGQRGALLARLVEKVADHEASLARLAALRRALSANLERAQALVDAASQLDKLNRDYKVAEAVFTSALARVNVARTDVFASYPMAQVTELPGLPFERSSPNVMLAIVAGIAASLFALLSLALGWLRRLIVSWLTDRPAAGVVA